MGKIEHGVGGTTELAMLRSGDSTSGASINDDVLLNTAYGAQFSVSIDDDLMQEKGYVYPYALQNIPRDYSQNKLSTECSVKTGERKGYP